MSLRRRKVTLKVYGLTVHDVHHGNDPVHQQARVIVAAPSQKAAAAAFGVSQYELSVNGGESWNHYEIELTMKSPGVVFIQSLDDQAEGEWFVR